MLPRRRDGEEMVLEDTGPSGSYTLVGVSYLARPISAYPITHGNGRNYGTQAIIHGVPIIPRHGRPRREREKHAPILSIYKLLYPPLSLSLSFFFLRGWSFFEICLSLYKFLFFFLSTKIDIDASWTFHSSYSFFPFVFIFLLWENIYIYIGEGDRVNERLRVMKMSVRGDVERAAWKEWRDNDDVRGRAQVE